MRSGPSGASRARAGTSLRARRQAGARALQGLPRTPRRGSAGDRAAVPAGDPSVRRPRRPAGAHGARRRRGVAVDDVRRRRAAGRACAADALEPRPADRGRGAATDAAGAAEVRRCTGGRVAGATDDSPTLALAISCVGRRLVLGQRVDEETEATLEALPAATTQIGFYSYGEISPSGHAPCDLHNQTMTLTTIREAAA